MKVTIKDANTKCDFSKSMLFISCDGNIVMSTGKYRGNEFSGILIKKGNNHAEWKTGCYSETWLKGRFKAYNGKITLEND
ncbi:hypothetical protein CMU14_13125 [Elizabethkingia anophelis]|nr:hypothetical protein [Elizabethkingia anophelis]